MLKPRKSRTRGNAIVIKRSKNSYIRLPRKVTLAPIGQPSRTLKPAMDLRATCVVGDVLTLPLPNVEAAFADPSRRNGERRTLSVNEYEPALAALMQEKGRMQAKRVGLILSGGNIDMPMFAGILAGVNVQQARAVAAG